MKVIYTVTSTCFNEGIEICSPRCWGWWPTEYQAVKSIKGNDGDMHEGTYNYLVLETFPPYAFGCAQKGYKKTWYTWVGSEDTGRWRKCKEPAWTKCVSGWGIG
jgi:hypothetical protein